MQKFIRLLGFCILFTLISFSSCQVDFQSICQAGIRQDNTNYIHCARKQLNAIPNFSRITNTFYDELVLNDNHIAEIPFNAFHGLRVKRLNLSGNRIRHIDPRAFRELANYLEELTIEFDPNALTEIPDAIKFNLINLRSLKLINLNLNVLRNHTFVKYRKLEELSIVKSNVKTIQSNAFRSLNQLRALHLDQNQLTEQIWSDLAEDLPNLETLTLSQNNIQSLKGNFHLTHVKLLDLSSNGLQSIENNFFQNLTRLEKLSLQNNELNSLHLAFLTLLTNLKELNLDFNRLTFIPENFFLSNKQLTYLSLQGNDLNSLTSKSFRGLSQLTYLNLARNRLQFPADQQPFQYLSALQIVNLDRNTQMNLSKLTFQGLEENLVELSLQNCNLSSFSSKNNPFDSFVRLQRLKLSSNDLSDLPENFLEKSRHSLISIDLQRNRFRSIPHFFGRAINSSKLTDIDLSSNQICTLSRQDLHRYNNLKTIGLTGNPLHCNCHLRWLKQWLIKNYDYDLVKFLQWTCATPMALASKQLTMIDEQEMICDDQNDVSQCQSGRRTTIKSTRTQLNMISSSTSATSSSTTATTTTTKMMSTSASSFDELIINDLSYNQNGMLTITWDSFSSINPKYYHLQIYDEQRTTVLLQRLIDGNQRAIELDIKEHLKDSTSSYIVCLNLRQKKFCRNLHLRSSPVTAMTLSSTSQDTEVPSFQFVYLLGGVCLGALFVSLILTLVCCWRIRYLSRMQQLKSMEKVKTTTTSPTNTFYPSSTTGAHSSIFYRPLNIISYPQPHHHHQQQTASCDTSECSLHSSTDTSQLASDTYHIYQQIPSVYNCHLHPTRTHILV